MNNFEMEMLNNSLNDLCNLFAEIHESSLSDEEREKYEKRKQYYEERFKRNRERNCGQ